MDVTGLMPLFLAVHALVLSGASGISASQIAMLALAVAGISIVMILTRRRIRDSQRLNRTSARQRFARLEEESRAGRDLEQVMLELDQLSRQVHGRINTQVAKLEAVMREADRKIESLTRLTRSAHGVPALEVTLDGEDPYKAASTTSVVETSRHANIYGFADRGMSIVDIAREVGKTAGEIELILALRKTKNEAAESCSNVQTKGI